MELGKQYKSFVKGKVLDVIGCKRKINHFLYDIGEIVYDKNGTINCYTMAIDSLPVECNSLCKVEVVEE